MLPSDHISDASFDDSCSIFENIQLVASIYAEFILSDFV